MDPARQLRILVAPFFYFASLLMGIFLAPGGKDALSHFLSSLSTGTQTADLLHEAAAVVGFITIATLPVGFLISTLTIFILQLLFWKSSAAYHAGLSDSYIERIWPLLGMTLERPESLPKHFSKKKAMEMIATTFDHDVLYQRSKGIHEWLMRSYTGYIASANGAVAILLSSLTQVTIIALSDRVANTSCYWWLLLSVLFLTLVFGAWRARRDTLLMSEFHSYREFDQPTAP